MVDIILSPIAMYYFRHIQIGMDVEKIICYINTGLQQSSPFKEIVINMKF